MKNQFKIKIVFLALTASIFFSSCISNVEEQLENPDIVVEVSFQNAVKPIIDARCVTCHSPAGGISPSLTNFDEVKARAERVKIRVDAREMPLGSTLNDAQIRLIVDWVNEGALNN